MARKSRKNMMLLGRLQPYRIKRRRYFLRLDYMQDCLMKRKRTLREGQSKHRWNL